MAFYARDTQAAAASLKAAQARIDSLHVPDELLVALQEMGERGGQDQQHMRVCRMRCWLHALQEMGERGGCLGKQSPG